jgi:TonB-dependent starch-binding outer membrane protein SusC
MGVVLVRTGRIVTIAALCAVAVSRIASGQEAQRITGQVLDADGKFPVPSVRIAVPGTTLGALTTDSGRFTLRNVPTDAKTIEVRRIGYLGVTVPLVRGQTDYTVSIRQDVLHLEQEVITGVATTTNSKTAATYDPVITGDQLNGAPAATIENALQGKVAGVQIDQNSGAPGGGMQVNIRGVTSIYGNTEPLYVVDGVLVSNATFATGLNSVSGAGSQNGGGTPGNQDQSVNRIADLNPNDIESIQVLEGAAAASIYGSKAAAGVIVITTKKGEAAEAPHWHFHGNLGQLKDVTKYPSNYGRPSDSAGAGNVGPNGCSLTFEFEGLCTGASGPGRLTPAFSHNLVADSSLHITGYEEGVGLSVEGGVPMATYYTGVDWDRQQGALQDNSDRKTHANGSFTLHPSPKIDIGLTALYTQRRVVLPFGDDGVGGPISGALFGGPGTGQYLFDGFLLSPSITEQIRSNEAVDRFTVGGNSTVRVLPWLTWRGNAGVDYVGVFDYIVLPSIAQSLTATPASAQDNAIYEYTGATSISAKYPIPVGSELLGTTTLGGEWVDYSLHAIFGGGAGIAPGTNSVAGATKGFTATETNQDVVNIGGYIQQQFAWRNVLFASVSGRVDGNSAFGANNSTAFYPSGNISYVISDEPYWPRNDYISSLRVRAAAGQSGREPTFRLATGSFTGAAYNLNGAGDQVGLIPNSIAVPNLKPERSTEYEAGFDVGFWKDRFTVATTVYDRIEKQLIESVPLDISTGQLSIPTNLGEVDNRGLELSFNGDLFRSRPVTVSLAANFAANRNKLVNFGSIPFSVVSSSLNTVQENIAGQPLGVYVSVPYTYHDLNHDGVIEPNEITYGSKPTIVGEPGPRDELTLSPTITVFRYFRLNAQFDRRDGVTVFDGGDEFRCIPFSNGRECNDPTAPLKDQAASVAANFGGTDYGYLLNGSFWKVREVSLTMIMPDEWARYLLGGRAASLTLAARNVATWTPYRGLDPEGSEFGGQVTLANQQFLTEPPLRVLSARVDITW